MHALAVTCNLRCTSYVKIEAYHIAVAKITLFQGTVEINRILNVSRDMTRIYIPTAHAYYRLKS